MTYCMDHKYEVFLRATKEVVKTPSWSGSKELENCILKSVSAKTKEGAEECKDVLYSVPCEIVMFVILGKLGSILVTEKIQHQRGIKSGKTTNGFFNDIKENPGHNKDFAFI